MRRLLPFCLAAVVVAATLICRGASAQETFDGRDYRNTGNEAHEKNCNGGEQPVGC